MALAVPRTLHRGLQQRLGTPHSVLGELRGAPNLRRPTEDAATAEEAVAAPPPPGRPNGRGDASGRLRARPNRPAGRKPGAAASGRRARPGPHHGRAKTPRTRYSARRYRFGTRSPRLRRPTAVGGRRPGDLLRGRVLGIVEIPHLRRRLRRQRLHEERPEAATLAPSPRQADAGEGTGGEAAAGPIAAAAAGAARVAGWLARPLAPSLLPSLRQPPAALTLADSLPKRRAPRPPCSRAGPAP